MKKVFLLINVLVFATCALFAQDYKNSFGIVAGNFNGLSFKTFIKEEFAVQVDLGFGIMATTGSYTSKITKERNSKGNDYYGDYYGGDYYYDDDSYEETKETIKANYSLWTFEINSNVIWQKNIASKEWCNISAVLGGGISFGYAQPTGVYELLSWKDTDGRELLGISDELQKGDVMYDGNNKHFGKFGINAMLGIELALKDSPITLGFDFRPGYGLMFTGHDKEYKQRQKRFEKLGYEYSENLPVFNFFDWSISASIRYTF